MQEQDHPPVARTGFMVADVQNVGVDLPDRTHCGRAARPGGLTWRGDCLRLRGLDQPEPRRRQPGRADSGALQEAPAFRIGEIGH